MIFHLLAFDDLIIDIDFYVTPYFLFEHLVYEPLISCPDILEAKGHHFVTVDARCGGESCMYLVFFSHGDLVIPDISVHEAEERMPGCRVD